jgi:hypothetical protein
LFQEDRLGRYIGEAPRLSQSAKEREQDNGSGPFEEGYIWCGSMLRTDKVKGKRHVRDNNV